MNAGDIGYQPEQVERKLEDLFFLANRWGCVLLLDEADVFLAKRKVSLGYLLSILDNVTYTYDRRMT